MGEEISARERERERERQRTVGYGEVDAPAQDGGDDAVEDEDVKDLVGREVVARRAEFQRIGALEIGAGTRARPRARVPVVAPAGLGGGLDVAGGVYGSRLWWFEDGVCGPGHDNGVVPRLCSRIVNGARPFFFFPVGRCLGQWDSESIRIGRTARTARTIRDSLVIA